MPSSYSKKNPQKVSLVMSKTKNGIHMNSWDLEWGSWDLVWGNQWQTMRFLCGKFVSATSETSEPNHFLTNKNIGFSRSVATHVDYSTLVHHTAPLDTGPPMIDSLSGLRLKFTAAITWITRCFLQEILGRSKPGQRQDMRCHVLLALLALLALQEASAACFKHVSGMQHSAMHGR